MTESTFDPIEARRTEVAAYEANITMYKAMAAALPADWPERLIQFKGATNQHEAIAQIDNLNDVELVSKLWAHDAAEAAIRSEMVELAKSKAILAALEAQA